MVSGFYSLPCQWSLGDPANINEAQCYLNFMCGNPPTATDRVINNIRIFRDSLLMATANLAIYRRTLIGGQWVIQVCSNAQWPAPHTNNLVIIKRILKKSRLRVQYTDQFGQIVNIPNLYNVETINPGNAEIYLVSRNLL